MAYGNWLTGGSSFTEDAAEACIRAALEEGITTFDTADVYAETRAETVLGRALSGVPRESYEICTKVYNAMGPGMNERGLGRKHVREGCENSLRRLQTDHLDLYQAHRFDATVPLEETMEALADLVHSGKVLYIGVSEWTSAQIREAHGLARALGIRLIGNQPNYSMLWRVIEKEVIPACERLGIGQMVWSPLAEGVLTGKYLPGSPYPAHSRATGGNRKRMERWLSEDVLTRIQALQHIAAEASMTLPQLAIAWVLQNDNVAAAIVGASTPAQVEENARAAGIRLDKMLIDEVDAVLGPVAERDPTNIPFD